jgi:hypothetical protein
MPRPMSADSRAVLVQLEESPKTIDALSIRTGIDKVRLAYMLRDLRRLGWVTVAAYLRKSRWRVRVYGLARRVPPAARERAPKPGTLAPNIAALYAAFRIGFPRSRLRGRRVRGAR